MFSYFDRVLFNFFLTRPTKLASFRSVYRLVLIVFIENWRFCMNFIDRKCIWIIKKESSLLLICLRSFIEWALLKFSNLYSRFNFLLLLRLFLYFLFYFRLQFSLLLCIFWWTLFIFRHFLLFLSFLRLLAALTILLILFFSCISFAKRFDITTFYRRLKFFSFFY